LFKIFPLAAYDIVETQIFWKTSKDLNIDAVLENSNTFNSSNIVVKLNFEFTEQKFVLRYFTFLDILSRIGGLSASIGPVMRLAGPWLMLYFLQQLCGIIKDYQRKEYYHEMMKFTNLTVK
jgi:hypothetical protein